jgi:hypothetical protein
VGSYWQAAQEDAVSFAFYNIIRNEFRRKLLSYVGNNVKSIVLELCILFHCKCIRKEMDSKALNLLLCVCFFFQICYTSRPPTQAKMYYSNCSVLY